MQIEPSSVADVELIGPDAPEFGPCMKRLVGGEPPEALRAALPFGVIVRNNGARPITLLGVRFNMVSPRKQPYSVVHYADTLRYPEKSALGPGALRFVCAEPRYTDMVLQRESKADRRGSMTLQNLAAAVRLTASLDCVAFHDGEFAGPDSHGAFERFLRERNAEAALIEEVLQVENAVEALLENAIEAAEEPARRTLAKQFHAALAAGELETRVRNHRLRMHIWRSPSPQTGALR
jgi:hypothetical protein